MLISQTSMICIKYLDDFKFRRIGHILVKGKTDKVTVYEIFNSDPVELAAAKLETRESFEQAINSYEDGRLDESCKLFKQCLDRAPGDAVAALFLSRCNKT